jgi:adenine-specific DNA-methyltransferase
VDRAFRCLSGSVAVSAYELENLPLPSPEDLARLLGGNSGRDAIEQACGLLYGSEGDL